MTPNKKGGKEYPAPLLGANNIKNDYHSVHQRYEYIPVDFVRGEVLNTSIEHIIEQAKANGISIETNFSDEHFNGHKIKHQNIRIESFSSGKIRIEGSIHTFFNEGCGNGNQFSKTQFEIAASRLNNELGILPENIKITQLEYGVNITPPIPTDAILNRCFYHLSSSMVSKIGRAHV